MELSIGVKDFMKMGGKFIAHKYRQQRLATQEYEVVNTSYGKVKGRKRRNIHREHGKYYAFEGIPYAKKPLGELRFRAPQPPEPWSGVLDCLDSKTKPMQYNYISKVIEGSEDCLYLNIYARKLTSEKPLPVMVWIYGGGFQIGEGTRDLYAPDYFMQRDVILITFHYRLGIFGFLCLEDPDLKIPGNAGLKDQVMTLKWVKANIQHFNGDPDNITVFGESAGGASAHFMTLTPQTKGLFHKAIVQSASVLCPWVFTERHDWCYKFAHLIGYKGEDNDKDVYEYLKKQPSKRLAFKDGTFMTKQELMANLIFFFGPVIEPYTTDDCITDIPFKDMLSSAWGNEIPLIIGANSSEGLLYHNALFQHPYLINDLGDCVSLLPDDVLRSNDTAELKNMASKLQKHYFEGAEPNIRDNFYQYMELIGHRTFWHGVSRTIKARCRYATNAPTFCYHFDCDSPFLNHYRRLQCGRGVRGVSHADDLPYLFFSLLSPKLSTQSPEYRCIRRLVGMWYQFALTSNPNGPETEPVVWQPVAIEGDNPIKCLNISHDLEFKDLPMHDKLKVWDGFYNEADLI